MVSQTPVTEPDETEGTTACEAKLILAELCTFASNNEVRDCLRLFDPDKSIPQLRSAFHRKTNVQLTATLEHVGITLDWSNFMKPGCTDKLISRLQNLLPKNCQHCNSMYHADKDDEPLLSCNRCGQEAHRCCITKILNVDDDIGEADVHKLINPYRLKCVHYLCTECEGHLYRNPYTHDVKNLKSINNKTTPMKRKQHEEDSDATVDTSDKGSLLANRKDDPNEKPPTGASNVFHSPDSSNKSDEREESTRDSGKESEEPTTTESKKCRYYIQGKCRHGVSGKNCQFQHPKSCPKLLKNGTRANTGCTKGKKCTYFHPKMCPSSLTKGVCVDRTCEKKHVKGTRRAEDGTCDEQPQQRQEQQQQQKQQQQQQQPIQQHASSQQSKSEVIFLELISLLKTELMEAMDKKIMMSRSQYPNTGWSAPMYHQTMQGSNTANIQNVATLPSVIQRQQLQHPYQPYLHHYQNQQTRY